MGSRHLIDPELLPHLNFFPSIEFSVKTLGARREASAALRVAPPDALKASAVERTERWIEGPAGAPQLRLLVYTPSQAVGPRPAILHIHGGGYVLGSPEVTDGRNRAYAEDLDCVVVSVDYRLAPETPFPGPLEDCYTALQWLHASAASLGVDPLRIAVTGESAGGGLAATLALLARDRGEIPLIFQHLLAPMVDDRVDPSHPFVGEFIWTRQSNHFAWSSYLGREPGGDGVSPYAAAARAEDLSGLPSTFIGVGALDLLLEQDLEYARRLSRAGTRVELHVYPGAFHGFEFSADAKVSQALRHASLDAFRSAFAGGAR